MKISIITFFTVYNIYVFQASTTDESWKNCVTVFIKDHSHDNRKIKKQVKDRGTSNLLQSLISGGSNGATLFDILIMDILHATDQHNECSFIYHIEHVISMCQLYF